MSWPGLATEVTQICKEIGLPDASRKDVTKEEIKKAIKYHHVTALKLELTGDKLKYMARSDLRTRRSYTGWGLLECRTQMFVCRANLPSMFNRDLTCRACTPNAEQGAAGPVEDQDHLEVCPGYAS